MKRLILPLSIAAALLVGIAIGFFVGRATLEAKWSKPITVVTPADYEKATAAKDADPTPPAGTKRLAALPLLRMREAVAQFAANDPLKITLTSFGNGEDGCELHLMMQNTAKCKVTSYSGIAYGFDAYGRPAKANAGGETYVAFRSDKTTDKAIAIESNGKYVHAQTLKHPEVASLGVAHVDAYTCADGTKWARQ